MKRLVVCVLLVGCGGDAGNGPVALDDLGTELGVASCALQFDCCTDAELMERYMGFEFEGQPITTEEQCVSFSNAVFTSFGVASYKASIEAGRAEYDADAAGECVAVLQGLSCAQFAANAIPTSPTGCRPFLIPKVGDGGACTQDYECTSNNCEGASNPIGEPSTEGQCKPIPAEGQPCDDNCTEGLFCGSGPSGKVCQPTRADGEQCNLDEQCTSDYCDTTARMCAQEPVTCDGV